MRRPGVHRPALVGLVVALVVGLAGCSDDPAPSGSPQPTASSSATPSASVPTLPEAAKGDGPKAAEAFVRHYVDLINYGLATLDSDPLAEASTEDCDGCATASPDAYRDDRRARRSLRGWRVDAQPSHECRRARDRAYDVRVESSGRWWRWRRRIPKARVARLPKRQDGYNFIVVQAPDGPSITQILVDRPVIVRLGLTRPSGGAVLPLSKRRRRSCGASGASAESAGYAVGVASHASAPASVAASPRDRVAVSDDESPYVEYSGAIPARRSHVRRELRRRAGVRQTEPAAVGSLRPCRR